MRIRRLSLVAALILVAVNIWWSPTTDPAEAQAQAAVQTGTASPTGDELGGPGTERPDEHPNPPFNRAARADYLFLDTLKLPWRCGDREPRLLILDWMTAGHASLPFALDFSHPNGGEFVRGTDVLAPTFGTVTKATSPVPTYGYWVQIDAGNGWQIFIAHLDGPSMAGPFVSTGDVVGRLGSSGTNEPHIHIEVRLNGGFPDVDQIQRVYGHPRDDFRLTAPIRTFMSNNCPTPTPTATLTPTSTPTPTSTATPTPTSTPRPRPSCAPRPTVHLTVESDHRGGLFVTVAAISGPGAPDNRVSAIRFGAGTNALIDIGDKVGATGGFSFVLPNAPTEVTFGLRRAVRGRATTLPLVVQDDCGDWSTFVGGGLSAF